MTAQEVKSDVVFKFSGSIDVAGLGEPLTMQVRGLVYPVNSMVEFGPQTAVSNATAAYTSAVTTAPANLGTGGANVATSHTGNYFSVGINMIKLPLGYTSGSQIAGTVTFPGSTFAAMGLNTGAAPYEWTLGNGQKVTLRFLAKVDNSAKIKALQKKVKKLKKQIRIAKRDQKVALLKKLKKQLKRTNAQIKRLR